MRSFKPTFKMLIHRMVLKWRYETGNGFVAFPPVNRRALDRQRQKHLMVLKRRRGQLLGEEERIKRELRNFEYEHTQHYTPTITFDSLLNWGVEITLTGSEELEGYHDRLNWAIAALAIAIERDTLGSNAPVPGSGWNASVVNA